MLGCQINDMFDEGKYINEFYVDELVNYICGNLNSWTPNRWYWERQYNYCNKLRITIRWRKSRGLPPKAKKGEMICRNNELINFFEDKSHLNCCGGV